MPVSTALLVWCHSSAMCCDAQPCTLTRTLVVEAIAALGLGHVGDVLQRVVHLEDCGGGAVAPQDKPRPLDDDLQQGVHGKRRSAPYSL